MLWNGGPGLVDSVAARGSRASSRATVRRRLRQPRLQGGQRGGDGADGAGDRERVPARLPRQRHAQRCRSCSERARLLELPAAGQHLGRLSGHQGVGAAGAGALPHPDGGRRHRGERARVLPLPPVGPAPGPARRHGGRGRVREGARARRARPPRHGRAVARRTSSSRSASCSATWCSGAKRSGTRDELPPPATSACGSRRSLTLFIFSFLYKDNPFYKFAEHLFVGVSAGYYIILNFWTVIYPNLIDPLGRAFAGHGVNASAPDVRRRARGLPRLARDPRHARRCCCSPACSAKIGWLSRWSLAVIIGVYAGHQDHRLRPGRLRRAGAGEPPARCATGDLATASARSCSRSASSPRCCSSSSAASTRARSASRPSSASTSS